MTRRNPRFRIGNAEPGDLKQIYRAFARLEMMNRIDN